MSDTEPIVAQAAVPPATRRSRERWLPQVPRAIAVVLLAGWLALLATSVVQGHRASSYDDLSAAVRSGDAQDVEVSQGLRPGSQGSRRVDIRWREGRVSHVATVVEAHPHRGSFGQDEVSAVLGRPVPDALRDLDPDLEVTVTGRHRSWRGPSAFGWVAPPETALLYAAGVIGTLLLLAMGPEPRRVTRWGWFWLVLMTGPLGSLAYLTLSGVLSSRRLGFPRPPRTGGGWAFILALFLGSVTGVTE